MKYKERLLHVKVHIIMCLFVKTPSNRNILCAVHMIYLKKTGTFRQIATKIRFRCFNQSNSFCFRISMSEINNKSPSQYVSCVVDYRRIRCVSCMPTTQTILCLRTDWSTTGGPGGGSKVSVCWSHAPKSPISRTTCNTLISWTASTAKTTWYVFKGKTL